MSVSTESLPTRKRMAATPSKTRAYGRMLMADPSNKIDDRPAEAPGRSVVREIADHSRLARRRHQVVGGVLLRSGHRWRLVVLPNVSKMDGRYEPLRDAYEDVAYAMRVRGGGWHIEAVWHNEHSHRRAVPTRWHAVAPYEVQYLPGGEPKIARSNGKRYKVVTADQVVGRVTSLGRRVREVWRVRVEA